MWKFRFLGYFSKAKTEKWLQKVSNVSNHFGITIPCSATYFMEVGARVSLKLTTKGSVKCKNTVKI